MVAVGLAQLNLRVGDLEGNVERIVTVYGEAVAQGAQLVVFSELTVTGYPPEDLLAKRGFVEAAQRALEAVAASTGPVAAVVGFPQRERFSGSSDPYEQHVLYNAAAACVGGRVVGTYRKQLLPNYSVFDERRYFTPGDGLDRLVELTLPATGSQGSDDDSSGGAATVRLGVSICEDIWGAGASDTLADGPWAIGLANAGSVNPGSANPDPLSTGRMVGPVAHQVAAGAELLANLSGSPYRQGKQTDREAVLAAQAAAAGVPIVYVNAVGGQDELVFDGGSVVLGADGGLVARLGSFVEAVEVVDVSVAGSSLTDDELPSGTGAGIGAPPVGSQADTHRSSAEPSANELSHAHPRRVRPTVTPLAPLLDPLEEVWQALVLATADYATKNGFTDVVLGTSGGIDSSLVAAIAVDALGAQHTHGVAMSSRYSSDESLRDARELSVNLGFKLLELPIEPAHAAFTSMLPREPASMRSTQTAAAPPAGQAPETTTDLTDQNLQSRIRGVLLMALSNRHGWLVLTTGNKTELSVGYSTLYGDTAGAYAVIKDCPKLLVYDLCRWRNQRADGPWIPQASIDKPPSAELRPNQRDDQSLPPYELLDPLVEAYVAGDVTADELVVVGRELGAPAALCRQVAAMVDAAEFKRRQSPLGPRISPKSFGKDRRMPITNAFR